MITTVTTTTTTVVTTTFSIAASLAIIGTITLIFFLIGKMLISSHQLDSVLLLSNRLNIAIMPLLMMFTLVVIFKIIDALHF